ncbi:MAG: hypothetical protein K6G51_08005 [Sphaerochaetaceae bacterium]|nr:hypothetical protein [Sphaerochaetaceae bacterium]
MKRCTIVTLVLSIISLVSSFVLKACAIAVGFQRVHYEGFGYSYTQVVVRDSAMGQILSAFSHMTFVLGIVLICVFAYLAAKNPKVKKVDEAKVEEKKKVIQVEEKKEEPKNDECKEEPSLEEKQEESENQ